MSDISRLALGTAQFGLNYGLANASGKIAPAEAADIVRNARTAGVDTLDTAVAYGDAETRLGEIGVADWRVVSKLPPLPEGMDPEKWVRQVVDQSLSNLRIPRLHGMLLHRPYDLRGLQGDRLYRAMLALQEDGLVSKIGVSVYGPDDLDATFGRFPMGLVQAPMNLVDRRLVTSGWLSRLKHEGVEVHVRSAFLQGLLLMTQQDRPKKFDRWRDIWVRWDRWQLEHHVSPQAACLAHPLSYPLVDRVVVGFDSSDQFAQLLAAAGSLCERRFPDLSCDDERLINPSSWNLLEN